MLTFIYNAFRESYQFIEPSSVKSGKLNLFSEIFVDRIQTGYLYVLSEANV